MSPKVRSLAGDASHAGGDAVEWLLSLPDWLPILVIWALVMSYVYINANAIFGADLGPRLAASTGVYMVLVALFYTITGFAGVGIPFGNTTGFQFLPRWAIAFVVTSAAVLIFFSLTHFHPPEVPAHTSSNLLLIFSTFIIAFPEELIFRDALPWLLLKGPVKNRVVVQVASGILFGFFHWTAYSGNPSAIGWAIGAGIVFGILREIPNGGTLARDDVGLAFSIGAHGTYDAAVFGAISIQPPDAALGLLHTLSASIVHVTSILPFVGHLGGV